MPPVFVTCMRFGKSCFVVDRYDIQLNSSYVIYCVHVNSGLHPDKKKSSYCLAKNCIYDTDQFMRFIYDNIS